MTKKKKSKQENKFLLMVKSVILGITLIIWLPALCLILFILGLFISVFLILVAPIALIFSKNEK